VLYNIDSLINKFTDNYICFENLFKIRGLEIKDNYFKGRRGRKRLRTTELDVPAFKGNIWNSWLS